MKLEHPLSGLFARCQTICVAECCGIDAYDFSPIHIASFLLLYRGEPDPADVRLVRSQLAALKVNYGSNGASAAGVTLDEVNQVFTGVEVDALVDEISANLDKALTLIEGIKCSKCRHPAG
ncbi:MAG: DUF6331 family protein [Zavarzinella sp.]